MKLSSISNLLARSFLIFIIVWLWTSFYVRGFFTILLISTSITLAINYAISQISKQRNNAKIITKQELEHMRQIILQLKFMSQSQTHALFKKALPPNVKENIDKKKISLYSLFHISDPTEQDIIKCINSTPSDSKIIITAESFPPSTTAFARSIDMKLVLLDASQVYEQILAPTQTFPEIKIQPKKATPKKTFREIKTMIFGRHRTKSYIITGSVILLSSIIIRLHLYYIIVATIVFALALTSHFSPSTTKNIFDI